MNNINIGKIMIGIGWVVLMGVLSMVFNYFTGKRQNPNQNPSSSMTAEKIIVTLEGTGRGQYVATGFINNQEVDFLVDTGATYVSIPTKIAEKIGAEKERKTKLHTANGLTVAWYTTLKTVRIGEIILHDVKGTISDNLSGEILLGSSFLRRLSISQENDKMTITQYR